jgi:polysaccharide export outer membrane protein
MMRQQFRIELPRWHVFRRTSEHSLTAVVFSLFFAVGVARGEGGKLTQEFPYTKQETAANGVILLAQNVGSGEVRQSGGDQLSNERARADIPATNSIPSGTEQGRREPSDPNAYIIGEQDALAITVWKEKEISGAVVVRPDGKITVPLVGEIKVVGMTPARLQSVLAEKLKPFVTVPQVTVAVTEIRSRKVYLIGRAAREGPFMINSSTTVLQIIAQAGGLKDFAKRKKIYILRQNGNEQVRIAFNYDDVIRGRHIEQNILLQPGDTIVVP